MPQQIDTLYVLGTSLTAPVLTYADKGSDSDFDDATLFDLDSTEDEIRDRAVRRIEEHSRAGEFEVAGGRPGAVVAHNGLTRSCLALLASFRDDHRRSRSYGGRTVHLGIEPEPWALVCPAPVHGVLSAERSVYRGPDRFPELIGAALAVPEYPDLPDVVRFVEDPARTILLTRPLRDAIAAVSHKKGVGFREVPIGWLEAR